MVRLALALLATVAGIVAIFLIVTRDRTFDSYEGAAVGQQTGAGLSALNANGWSIVHSEGAVGCQSLVVLTQFRSPDFTLAVRSEKCQIKEISRKKSRIEL